MHVVLRALLLAILAIIPMPDAADDGLLGPQAREPTDELHLRLRLADQLAIA